MTYNPDIPTWPDPNSREAAAAAEGRMPYRRKLICWTIAHNPPDTLSCWDFCELGPLKGLGHGGTSGTLSGLRKHGLLLKGRLDQRKRNGHGRLEWTHHVNPILLENWTAIDWTLSLEEIDAMFGLTSKTDGTLGL